MELQADKNWIIFDEQKLEKVMNKEEKSEYGNILSNVGKKISEEETERSYKFLKRMLDKHNVLYKTVEDE